MCRERMAIYASEGRSPTRRLRIQFPKVLSSSLATHTRSCRSRNGTILIEI